VDVIREFAIAVTTNLKIDFATAHRDEVKAAVRAVVKRVLRKPGVLADYFDTVTSAVVAQAEALW
jgi:hypothetical protein